MSTELQTVVFIAQVRIHDAKALQVAAAERAFLDGLSAHAWAAMRSGCSDDVVMLLDPGSIAGAGFEIVQSRCEVLAHGADAADGGPTA
jgi:hypothetical protein